MSGLPRASFAAFNCALGRTFGSWVPTVLDLSCLLYYTRYTRRPFLTRGLIRDGGTKYAQLTIHKRVGLLLSRKFQTNVIALSPSFSYAQKHRLVEFLSPSVGLRDWYSIKKCKSNRIFLPLSPSPSRKRRREKFWKMNRSTTFVHSDLYGRSRKGGIQVIAFCQGWEIRTRQCQHVAMIFELFLHNASRSGRSKEYNAHRFGAPPDTKKKISKLSFRKKENHHYLRKNPRRSLQRKLLAYLIRNWKERVHWEFPQENRRIRTISRMPTFKVF